MNAVLGPTLETSRLILRPPVAADFEPWAAFMADEEASHFIGGPQPRSTAWRGFCSMAGSWAMFGYAMFSVVEKDTGRWVGRLGPWVPAGWPGTEVGWGVIRDVWGKGYAPEGATAAIDWCFDHLGWTEVIHCIESDNPRSQPAAALREDRGRRLGSIARGMVGAPGRALACSGGRA
jgi:RimJ/RimL family protein N-acetyltransferase